MYQTTAAPPATLPAHGCVIRGVRLSFFHGYKPEPNLNNVPVYSMTLLIPKSYPLGEIEQAVNAAIAKGVKDKWNGYRPPNLLLPLKDGDAYAAQKPEKRQPYIGHWFINCNQNPEFGKPVILNEKRILSTDPQEVQSGDYADVVVEFVPFNNKSMGVSSIPKVVRKTATGERFTSGMSESDALAAVGGLASESEIAFGQNAQNINSLF